MVHTIKCACDACHCMIENDPGVGEYCSPVCQSDCSASAEDDAGGEAAGGCPCRHQECGKLREVGSGPGPASPV